MVIYLCPSAKVRPAFPSEALCGQISSSSFLINLQWDSFYFLNGMSRVIGNSKSSDFIAKPAGALFGKQGWPV
ncbi:MAG TPA: hypothetical protein PK372_09010 [Rugosibacter sp.]|nr:hypothetical protein [Rugosibacter sp.]HPB90506.1 hypothetical protein [Rugosibacter sp.]HQN47390.1 hypothetical protein [Rugosibacter sp.]HQQ36047.1 hypothetical protein [Rugosibacter sp.]